jgi:formate hydrogenlyase transcriptional activator
VNEAERLNGNSPIERYEALIRASQAITAHRDPERLFVVLAGELRRLVRFDYLRLSLADGIPSVRGPRVMESPGAAGSAPPDFPAEENIARWVYDHQQLVTISSRDEESRFPGTIGALGNSGVHAACVLPLKTAHHRIGTLMIGHQSPDAYTEDEVKFLVMVADTVAVALDDTLNFEAAQRSQERLKLLLDLNNRVASNLELRDLLRAISASIRRVMQSDGVVVSLPEPETNELRMYAIDFPESKGFAREDNRVALDGTTPFAKVFQTGQLLNFNSSDLALHEPPMKVPTAEGLNALLLLPLVGRTGVRGVLGLGRRQGNGFTQDDIDFLGQVASQVTLAIENALAYGRISELKDRLVQEKLYLQSEISSELNFEEIVGKSAALRQVLKQVEMVAPTDSTVLIYGETGTGKELIARAVHNLSARRPSAFVKLNCAAIPTGLLESELFGHEKGAFTGAIAQRIGRFELAHRGSIFLDEIGDVPLELQSKLLRVLQEREFERLGSTRTLQTDARLIAATNRDLTAMVEEQKFRSDLFYRLNVFPIHIPSLRERPEDIPLLVRHFVQQFSRRMHKNIETIPTETMNALLGYHWPGNIRELQNVMERAVIVSEGPVLKVPVADLQPRGAVLQGAKPNPGESGRPKNIRSVLNDIEREQILSALERTNWVVAGRSGAAAQLGLKRSTLQLRMQKLGISRRYVSDTNHSMSSAQ